MPAGGGAPEDPTPLWGWYYRSGNDKAPAWSGVEPFWRFFTRFDREDGLRGVECGPEDLQPGDVIQLSFDGGVMRTACSLWERAADPRLRPR